MEQHPDVALLSGDVQRFSSTGIVTGSMFENEGFDWNFFGDDFYALDAYRKMVVNGNFVVTSAVLLRASSLDSIGLFDEQFWRCEDIDLWLRVACRFRLGYSLCQWARKRAHGRNLTADSASMTVALIRVLEKHEREYGDWLVQYCQSLGDRPILFPTSDTLVLMLARHRTGLDP